MPEKDVQKLETVIDKLYRFLYDVSLTADQEKHIKGALGHTLEEPRSR
jgi:hypothetical protein